MKYFYTTTRLSENMHETPEGFLVCVAVPIARTGEMVYGENETPLETGDDGLVKITRDEKEVFRPDTMASFEGKAVTITHPNEFVSPQNWSRLAKGVVQNVRRGEGDQKNDLLADLLITDAMTINLVKSGLREVSCGYEAQYIELGDGKGKQIHIVGNHLALVEEGRAGSSYAINDHKGKGAAKMKLSERIKAIFAKAQDEAMKLAEDEAEPKEEKKDDKKVGDAGAYDELVKVVNNLSEMVKGMGGKQKDATPEAEAGASGETVKKAGDEEVAASLEDRLKALEASVAKLLEAKAGDEDLQAEGTDEAEEEGEESEDDDFEESTMTGDTASRAEILAPGIKATKDVKAKALKIAYGTTEGKKIIEALNGGKAPAFDSAEKVEMLFTAASEVLKVSRTSELSKTKQVRDSYESSVDNPGVVSAEKLNEINAKFYKRS